MGIQCNEYHNQSIRENEKKYQHMMQIFAQRFYYLEIN